MATVEQIRAFRKKIKELPQHLRTEKLEAWRNDFELFCIECLTIIDKDNEYVPFKFNRFQKHFWKILKDDIDSGTPSRIYLLKARQLGSSTFVQALAFWRIILWPNSNGLVAAHAEDPARNLFNKSRLFLHLLPQWVKPTRQRNNRKELYFATKDDAEDPGLQSMLSVGTIKNVHIGAGSTLHVLHLSEFARYESVQSNVRAGLRSLFSTVPERGRTFIILETTAWGMNYSHDLWFQDKGKVDGFEKVKDWTRLFVSWLADDAYTSKNTLAPGSYLGSSAQDDYGDELGLSEVIRKELKYWYPEKNYEENEEELEKEVSRRLNWRRGKIAVDFDYDVPNFQQEYPSTPHEAFITTGTTVFSLRHLAIQRERLAANPDRQLHKYHYNVSAGRFEESAYGNLRVYEEPQDGYHYVIGADVGRGLADGDKSVAQVLKLPHLEQVACLSDRVDTHTFAKALAALGHKYNTAQIGVEVNGPGLTTNMFLSEEINYPWLYWKKRYDKSRKEWTREVGWDTNVSSKEVIIAGLRSAITNDYLIINDEESLTELEHYILDPKTHKMGAVQGKHDDQVMSMAIALQIATEFGGLESTRAEQFRPKWSFEWWASQADKLQARKDKRRYA